MSSSSSVHWHEGLFLRQHHMQMLDRQGRDRASGERRLWRRHAYGVIEARLVTDSLANFSVQFDRLRAVMSDGTLVDVPGNADLEARDIRAAFRDSTKALTVRLGVPKWSAQRGNTFEGEGKDAAFVKRYFRLEQRDVPDENTGENIQPMLVRRINARIVLPGDDEDGMELLELARLEHSAEDETDIPREDISFVPPCFCLGGSATLRYLLRDLSAAVTAAREEHVNRLAPPGGAVASTIDLRRIQQSLRLRTLNRFAATLPTLVSDPTAAPLDLYLELRALQGELASLQPEMDKVRFPALEYNHDNLGEVFRDLNNKIRPMLKGDVQGQFKEVRFRAEGRYWSSDPLADSDFTIPTDYLLGIRTSADPRTLESLIRERDDMKLLPANFYGTGKKARVPGIKLERDFEPPTELPRPNGQFYFRLLRNESLQMWKKVQEQKKMIMEFSEGVQLPIQDMKLYLLLPAAAPGA